MGVPPKLRCPQHRAPTIPGTEPRGARGGRDPRAGHFFTFHFLRALNLRKFLMLMEERLRFRTCCLLGGCGDKDTALSPRPQPAPRGSSAHPCLCRSPAPRGGAGTPLLSFGACGTKGDGGTGGSLPQTPTGRTGMWGQRREPEGRGGDGDGDENGNRDGVEIGMEMEIKVMTG